MLHQVIFLALYLGAILTVPISPFTGILLYYWLEDLPPDQVYQLTLLPGNLSLVAGGLAFFAWLIREKKTVPRPLLVTLLMAALLLWVNITSFFALAPEAGQFEWERTVKVIGFAILTAQMLSSRGRIEAFVWVLVLSASYFAIPGAIKVIVSGGSGGIGTGDVVVAATGSFFGDRVILSVVLAMTLPFVLYLGWRSTLLPPRWLGWVRPTMLGIAGAFLIAAVGTFARTALFAIGATVLMLTVRSQKKMVAVFILGASALTLLAFAPDNWFDRMGSIADYQNDSSAMDRIAVWKWAWTTALDHPIVGGGFGVFTLDAGSIPGKPGWLEAHNIFFSMLGVHGFVGLGLFCCLILAMYRSCAVVQRRARGREDLAWMADLARANQVGLIGFIAGGMFVSIATGPFLYTLAAITVGLRGIVERETVAILPRAKSTMPRTAIRPV